MDQTTLGRGMIGSALFGDGVDAGGAIGWVNTFLPLVLLVALTLVLPLLTVPRGVMDQRRLALGMGLAGALVFISAMGLFALFHVVAGGTVRLGALPGPAALSALVWGPVWALVWLVRAQGVEARKGRAAARAGLDLGDGG